MFTQYPAFLVSLLVTGTASLGLVACTGSSAPIATDLTDGGAAKDGGKAEEVELAASVDEHQGEASETEEAEEKKPVDPAPKAKGSEPPALIIVDVEEEQVPVVVDVVEEGIAVVETTVMEECASTEVEATDKTTYQPADIILAIDTSRSMREEAQFLQQHLSAFSEQIVASGIDAHVVLVSQAQGGSATFGGGRGGGNIGVCIPAPLGSGNCPNDTQLPGYAHIVNPVGSHDILNVLVDTYPQWSQHLRAEASTSIVVISDDNASLNGDDPDAINPDAPQVIADNFVAAVQGLSAVHFDEWTFNGIFCGRTCEAAAAIGTVFQDLVARTDGVAGELCDQDFQPVFDRLAQQIIQNAGSQIACEWDFPRPPAGQTFSAELVKVERTSPQNGTVAFSQVGGEAECTDAAWFFDDPANPTKILACPQTCEAIQQEEGGKIDVTFGCELIDGCAVSSSTSIGAGAEGELTCEFPLPVPPDNVVLDHSTVNVRYATPAGFGVVLGIVDSREACESVDGGWYYDDADQPASINLCPATCAEYREGNVVDVQALFGCASKPAAPLMAAQ